MGAWTFRYPRSLVGKSFARRRRRRVVVRWVFVALAILPIAATARGQTLQEALVQAYQTNPTLQVQRANLRSSDEGVSQALSNWRPTVTYTTQFGRNRVDSRNGSSITRELRKPESHNLTIEQPLFRGGRTLADTSRAENEVLSERAKLAAVEQDILLAASTAFMDVVRDQAVVELTTANEKTLGVQLEAARYRFTLGEANQTDVSQANARVARANAERIQAEGDLEVSRATYFEIIGTAAGTLRPSGLVGDIPESLDDALAAAARKNPTVISTQYAEKAARDNIELVEGELWPTLSITGALESAEASFAPDSIVETASIVATLTVPLYQSGAVSSRVRDAKQIAGRRRLEIDEARRAAVKLAMTWWELMTAAHARVSAFRVEINSNRLALNGVLEEVKVGLRTVLDALDAEQELLDAQVNLVGAQRDEFVAAMQLLAAVGRLTARTLELPVDYYNEQDHYNRVRGKFIGLQ